MLDMIDFDYQKATQAINYFTRKNSNCEENKMKVIKLIWLADRHHLRKYGRPIIGDDYRAMKLGPVGSGVRDIIDNSEFAETEEINYSKDFIKPISKYVVASLKPVDYDVFSDTDEESLKFAYDNFGLYNEFTLSEIAHKYPEWRKFKIILDSNQFTRMQMNYLDFFDDPQMTNDKFALSKKTISQNKEAFTEMLNLQDIL